ncbi:NAD(P)/FAD-dependent oxidoreductase [Klenkia taihuensis]|uniref:Phthalate 3,4-dioxygenase, ferredoxin reductase subunit n=1 Tax=Klenkia taihuensis TaxID=1225127 RepID=A0A1I1Q0J7_9ACTN|nr:FAD-dependent oxidoreductase [Klenkia taihuensis]GHE08249.1 pyridine nucleotide-disulfide oxidoreductase [Klenkia taihuensis]SFD15579.1 phthalate 3,4-dioxygenase, ferredoxin reductase subunit [Klenkia taihuensis]
MSTVVVVGSSVAGVRTVQALRSEGFTGRVVLVGAEPELPYDKPPLSKQFLAGAWDTDRIRLLTAERAAELDVELRLGSAAERLDVAGRQVHLADGSVLGFDAVVLATGAAARPSPWPVESGVHVVRSLTDARALRAGLDHEGPVVVVGGGFIGAEVAATASALGRAVTVVDPLPSPIGRVVGAELGEHFTGLHHRHGVVTRFGTGVESVTGVAGDLAVALTDGTTLPAATVVVGIGATPNDGWLATSGLLVENGVTCDEHCRAVDAPDVLVVGDLARWYHPGHGEHLRVEHWTNAVDSAVVAAHNIAHPDDLRTHAPVEYVWSDQYDWRIQIVGRPARAARHELVGSLTGDAARAAAVYTDDEGRLLGAVTVNWPKALVLCRRLLGAGATAADALAQLAALPAARVAA